MTNTTTQTKTSNSISANTKATLRKLQASKAGLVSSTWMLIGSSHYMNVLSDSQIKKSMELIATTRRSNRSG